MTPERPSRLAADRNDSAFNYPLGMRGSSDFQIKCTVTD
jgi:hypothetical protein